MSSRWLFATVLGSAPSRSTLVPARWRRTLFRVEQLEDRLAPAFLGGVRVGVGDLDADGFLDIVTGAGPGGGAHVRAISGRTGGELYSFLAADADDRGGVTVAVGDVTGDGAADILTSAPGRAVVRIWDGRTGQPVRSLPAFDAVLAGSLSLATGDVTGDGRPDIVVGAGVGGGPHVKAFDGVSGQEVKSFFAYAPDFHGGVNVAVGDVTGDGAADIITGAGAGGGPHVRVFDGKTGGDAGSFYAMDAAFTGGVQVAAADVRGLGRADILVGAGFGGGPRVQIVDGRTFTAAQDFFAYSPDFRGGVYLAAADLNADGLADVVTGAGPGGGPHVRGFDGGSLAPTFGFFAYPLDGATPFSTAHGQPPVGPPPPPPGRADVPPPPPPPGRADVTPPAVSLTGVPPAVTNAPTVAGRVADDRSGVTRLEVSVDGGAFTTLGFDADGEFVFTPPLPRGGAADGPHAVRFRAADGAGNATADDAATTAFTLDTVAPTVTGFPAGTLRLSATELIIGFSEPVDGMNLDRFTLTTASGAAVPLAGVDVLSPTRVRLRLAAPLADGDFTLAIGGLTDLAGNPLGGATTFPFSVADPAGIVRISPADGTEMVSLTRETRVTFDEPIDPATVTSSSFYLIAKGDKLAGTVRVSPTKLFATFFYSQPLPESTQVRVVVDGAAIRGADGLPLDADGDGEPGGTATADFRTLPLTLIPGTRVFGYVYDSYTKAADGSDVPVVGATISLDANPAIKAVTDADGFFELGVQDLNGDRAADGLPAPEFFVHVDGGTASSAVLGADSKYATLGKPFHSVPGQRVQLRMDGSPGDVDPVAPGVQFHMYLPPMAMADIVPLDGSKDQAVGFGPSVQGMFADLFPDLSADERALLGLMSVTYPAGSAVDADGTVATKATIVPVNPLRLPAPLPPGQNPRLVISVQAGTDKGFNLAGGNMNFETPAPITFPNLEGLAPGEQSLIWSFDHDAGKWLIIGNATVSADGKTVTSNPGVGILAPGWHFTQVGTVTEGEPCVENQVCVQVNGGRLGDVIEVDLSGNGGREFQLSSSSAAGRVAEIDNWENVLATTGKFYFIPNIPDSEARFTQAPVTAEYTFSGIGRLASDPPEAPERRLFFTVQIKDIQPGYSTFGTSVVPTGTLAATDKLGAYRLQQRLRYFGYKTTTGDGAPTITVDGAAGNGTRHANGVLNAAVSGVLDENHTPNLDVSSWINARNAPLWVEYRIPSGVTDNEVNHEHWMTSWTRDSLQAFDAAYAPAFTFNGASQTGGGDTPHHGTHEAGMDLDIDISVAEQATAQAQVGTTGPLTANEQAVVDRMMALYSNATVPVGRMFIGFQRIVDAFNAAVDAANSATVFPLVGVLDPGNVHDNHIHIDYQPPAINAGGAGLRLAGLSGAAESNAPGFGTDRRMAYRFEMGNGLVLSGKTTPTGGFSEVLTPNTAYTATFYQPATNKSAVYAGKTNASGQITPIGTIILDRFGGPDADGDGIPDIGETVLGTNPNSLDSDGDGILDAAELEQGLNPVDGVGFPTGVIASITLPGSAQAVTVADDLVYVATGSHGLAIMDGSRFDQPVLLGQIDLPGTATDVTYDSARKLAAVATGTSLELIDVADPMTPRVIQSIALNATRAEAVNGLVYAAAGGFLRAFDLGTGSVVQTLILPVSGEVTGMAREGGTLYAYVSGSDTLLVIDVSREGEAAVRGQLAVNIASSDVGVFAGNGVVTLAGNGLTTIDVSNPAAPGLISGADSFFNARRVALNGSGLALVAPDGGNTLDLYSSADPADTDNFLTRYTLSGPARDVAVSRGIGYVAAGGRLDVVNYRPFDAQGQAPTVTLTAEAADADPNTDGVQVLEGGTVFLRAAVTDDVQARVVEWLVNGQVAGTDVSFPFDFAAPVPVGVGGTVIVQARVTDTGGNTTTSDPVVFAVVPDTFAPTITSIDPADAAQRFEGQRFVRVRFSEALNPAGVTPASFRLESAGPNGTFGDADDAVVAAALQLRDSDRLVQLTVASPGLAPGVYRLVIDQTALADRAGNPLGAGPRTAAFTVVEFDQSAEFLPFGTDVSVRRDDTSFAISEMPFAFEYFGQVVTGPVYVTTNGVVEFGGNTIGGRFTNQGLPVGTAKVAMPLWDDLFPPSGGTIGLYDADGVRVISFFDLPHFSNTSRRYNFQVAFFASGQVQMRYGRMDPLGDGAATIGLSDGTRIAVPSLGNIVNDPNRAVTSATGALNQAGLDALTEDDQNDLLVFTPDGTGGYTIVRNPGR